MQIEAFGEVLKRCDIARGAGVPCSYFAPLVSYMASDPALDYVSATSEGEAVAIAAGMVAAGRSAFALMQNSGLGNAVNPITSLLDLYRIPVALFVSQRGQPGVPDEPQHARMGSITEALTKLCGLRTHLFEPEHFESSVRAMQTESAPSAWIVRKGALSGAAQAPAQAQASFSLRLSEHMPERAADLTAAQSRQAALEAIAPLLNRGLAESNGARSCAVVATTGKLSRELFELDDHAHDKRNRFYMVGSMGCAAGFALGITRARPERGVIVLDGDGAVLMKLGSLATIGCSQARRFHHVVFDNGVHDSTGGQPTASRAVDLALVALACGYEHAATVTDLDALRTTLTRQLDMKGPTFLRVLIRSGSRAELGRPSLSPRQCYERFSAFLASEGSP